MSLLFSLFPLVVVALGWWLVIRLFRSRRPRDAGAGKPAEAGRRNRALGGGLVLAEAPAPPGASYLASRPATRLQRVEERVSVVLRRQVPVRFGEAPRSWLGGLPMLPPHVAWPTGPCLEHAEHGDTPLHFVAQIACEDLPEALWGGLGPRAGWLVFFLNAQEFDYRENPRATRVIHIDALGPERAPPPGIQPMRDEGYTGYGFDFLRSQAEIPPVWRRWPVDLVAVSNTPVPGAPSLTATPEDFAQILYDGAPVSTQTGHFVSADNRVRSDPASWPFTWRGALYVVDSIARVIGKSRPIVLDARDTEMIETPGWVEATIAAVDAETVELEAKYAEVVAGLDRSDPAAADARKAKLDAYYARTFDELDTIRAFLHDGVAPAAPAELIARIRASLDDYAAWRSSRGPVVEALRSAIVAHDLDAAMSPDEFAPIHDALAGDSCGFWCISYGRLRIKLPTHHVQSLADCARDGFRAARAEEAADCYVDSPERRARIPADLLAEIEPYWRRLDENRPHRMGGLHDGVQSEAAEVPTSRLLLLQIATDDALQWCWGDAGAVYLWIDAGRLAANDFSQIETDLESH